MGTELKVVSFNCRGFQSSKDDIDRLARQADIFMLQEHWIRPEQFSVLNDVGDSKFAYTAVSPMEKGQCVQGRPFGGVALLWRNTLQHAVTVLRTGSDRMCAIIVDAGAERLLCASVYLPYDSGSADALMEYEEQLGILESLCSSMSISGALVMGDFNADVRFNRRFGLRFREFVHDNSLTVVDLATYERDNDFFTWESGDAEKRSWLDYALSAGSAKVCDFRVLDEVVVLSDHWPVTVRVDVDVDATVKRRLESARSLNWSRCSEENLIRYQWQLIAHLDGVDVPWRAICCAEPGRCSGVHERALLDYCDVLVKAMVTAGRECIPLTGSGVHRVAGWHDGIRKSQRVASNVYWEWKQLGKPRSGPMFHRMKMARSAFRKDLRDLHRVNDRMAGDKLLHSLQVSDQSQFWDVLRRHRKVKRTCFDVQISGKRSAMDICEVWKEHFCHLGNAHNSQVVQQMNDKLDGDLNLAEERVFSWLSVVVSSTDCLSAASKLQLGKAPGLDSIQAEHFKFAPRVLFDHMARLFTGILKHECIPYQFRPTVVVPIVKNKNEDLNNVDNYRGIALSSVVGKLLEKVLLEKFSLCWKTSDQQFGFKPGHGCDSCSYTVRETVLHFLENGNDVVFDSFWIYRRRMTGCLTLFCFPNCCVFLVKFLRKWYQLQEVFVRWDSHYSSSFTTANGVRQGSVLSPVLFNVFIDGLICSLDKSGYGPRLNGVYVGCNMYADDAALISPTRFGMQRMLDTSEDFAQKNLMKFNITKSKVMVFRKSARLIVRQSAFRLGNGLLEEVEEFLHLGHLLPQVIGGGTTGVQQRCRKFFAALFSIVGVVRGVGVSAIVWQKVMMSILLLILAYGCELWAVGSRQVERLFHRTWRSGFRRGLSISDRVSLKGIYGATFTEGEVVLRERQLLFLWRAVHSRSRIVQGLVLNPATRSNLCSMQFLSGKDRASLMCLKYQQFRELIRSTFDTCD
eukprot:m.273260 g.273260  ORF g.273260 m.273260 type:complete len:967 (+) comp40573_c0_seq2:1097-3997(+)